MPFQKHVYYPLANSPEGPEAPEAGAGGMAFVAASAATGPLPFFQFRPRLESVDWRRLSAIDVDKVAGAVDVLTLQENIMNITFCKLEDEKCPHCQSGVDPVLLKLIRLAQLTIEYLMHSQDFLTSQLNLLEERLRLSLSDYEQSKQLLSKQASEIKLLKEECKRRKKMLSAQQLMIEAKATYYQCHFCDKAFMNQAFLQSHIQRRHPSDSHLEYNTKAQTDKLQKEIDMLKEQLQLTKSQLESAQHAHAVRFSKEYEMQKAKEDDILKLFDRWKEEEKEKLVDEMEKVKQMFMKEFKELTSKNSALEYQLLEIQRSSMQIRSNIGSLRDAQEDHVLETPDLQNMLRVLDGQTHKWSDRCQFLNQEHDKEKGQLLSHIDRLRDTVIHELSEDNVYYKKRIDELDQKLKEQNELILTQRQQINDFTSKPFTSVVELKGNSVTWQALESKSTGPTVSMNASTTQTLEAKPSLTVAHEQVFSSHVLEPIEELSSEEEKGRENEYKLNKKTHLRKVLKEDDLSPIQLRVKLEKEMKNKLKGFGINPEVQGVTNETLYSALQSMKSNRYNRVKQIPNIEQIRESIELQLFCKVQERERQQQHCPAVPSVPPLDSFPLEEVPKPVPLFPKGRQLVRQRSVFHDKVAAPKIKKNVMEDHFARKFTSTKTPPFSSEEEIDDDDFVQAYMSPDLLNTQPPKSNLSSAGRNSVRSDQDWTEGSEMDDVDVSPKPTGTSIKIQTENVENIVLHQGNGSKPVGGINDVETFVKKEATQELKCTDVDDDDWDISSLEEEKSLGQKTVTSEQREPFPVKRDLSTSQVPRAWGPIIPRECKEEGHQENEPNTLKSSLVTMTDWSDFLDV